MTLIALAIAVFLAAGAGFHFYWGFGGRAGLAVAVPHRADGGARGDTPLFTPSKAATLGVAFALSAILAVLVVYALRLDLPVSRNLLRVIVAACGAVFLARGLVWHPYVGFFKTVRTTAFARNDTFFYSPACVLAGLGFLLLAWEG